MLKYINENTNTQEEYGYASARVRELEKNLLNQEILNKMIESADLENALKILAESNVNEYLFDHTDSLSIDQSLNDILKKTIQRIGEISPYPYLYHLFNLKYDFYNLKVLLKAKYLSKNHPYPTYNVGNIDQDMLKGAVFEDKFKPIPIKVERIIRQAQNEYMKSENFQLMEILLDQGYYEILFDQLENLNQAFLFYFYKTEVDLTNIIIACRSKIRGIKKSKLPDILLKYGYFSHQKMITIYENSIHSWANHFQKTDYAALVENGIKYWEEEESLLEIERLKDNFLLELLKIGKYNTFGMESVIGYYYAKENDVKNIRIILNGKRYSLPDNIIRKKLRIAYV